MREVGIDLSAAHPQRLTDSHARDASLLITMGCGDDCPYVPALARGDWRCRIPKISLWLKYATSGRRSRSCREARPIAWLDQRVGVAFRDIGRYPARRGGVSSSNLV
jgi:hypothetical protein